MIVRLLVVGLTLIGALPIRICTCGAASESEPVVPLAPSPCSHRHGQPDGLFVGVDTGHTHHDADCHAVKPRPNVKIPDRLSPARAGNSDTAEGPDCVLVMSV